MAFQVSPGVLVQEKDLTNVIHAVATSIGAIAGDFTKGPTDDTQLESKHSCMYFDSLPIISGTHKGIILEDQRPIGAAIL